MLERKKKEVLRKLQTQLCHLVLIAFSRALFTVTIEKQNISKSSFALTDVISFGYILVHFHWFNSFHVVACLKGEQKVRQPWWAPSCLSVVFTKVAKRNRQSRVVSLKLEPWHWYCLCVCMFNLYLKRTGVEKSLAYLYFSLFFLLLVGSSLENFLSCPSICYT